MRLAAVFLTSALVFVKADEGSDKCTADGFTVEPRVGPVTYMHTSDWCGTTDCQRNASMSYSLCVFGNGTACETGRYFKNECRWSWETEYGPKETFESFCDGVTYEGESINPARPNNELWEVNTTIVSREAPEEAGSYNVCSALLIYTNGNGEKINTGIRVELYENEYYDESGGVWYLPPGGLDWAQSLAVNANGGAMMATYSIGLAAALMSLAMMA